MKMRDRLAVPWCRLLLTSVSGCARRGRCRDRRDLANPHLAQCITHGVHRQAHLVRTDRADAADAEGLDLRELAGIEDEAFVAHARIEFLERVSWIGGSMEGDDDG